MKPRPKLLILLMSIIFVCHAYAYDIEVDGIYYNVDSEKLLAIVAASPGDSYEGYIEIPEFINYNNKSLEVVSISYGAFSDCDKLINVIMPNSIQSIEFGVFARCGNLEKVTLSENLTILPPSTFLSCYSLNNILLPNKIETIQKEAFNGCSSLTEITIPNSVITIEDTAFRLCTSLKKVKLSNNLINLGAFVFQECYSLEEIDIPNSTINIGFSAFYQCKKLKNAIIGNGVTKIENNCFQDCISLSNVNIGDAVTEIGSYAFQNCSTLRSVKLPPCLTKIDYCAFYNSALDYIIIPGSVTSVDTQSFGGCENLKKFIVAEGEYPISLTNANILSLPNVDFLYLGKNTSSNLKASGNNYFSNLILGKDVTEVPLINWWTGMKISLFTSDPPSLEEQTSTIYMNVPVEVPHGTLEKYQNDKIWGKFWNLKERKEGNDYAIILNVNKYTLNVNESVELEVITLPISHKDVNITWNISNSEIAVINENGEIKGISPGSTTVTVSTPFCSQDCLITVNPIKAESISLNIEEAILKVGEILQLHASILPEETTDQTVTWKSSNEEIVIVNEQGIITALSEGIAKITATCSEVSATCEVKVINPIIQVEQIVLNIEETELNIGESIQLEATLLPEDSTDKTIIWNSSNENIVTVSESGLVTAISEGIVIITATCGEVSATCEITVINPTIEAEQILLNNESAQLNIRETIKLEAIVLPDDTTNKTVTWNSSNEEVASVSEDGLVLAVSEGSAIITAICGEASAECIITVLEDAGVESLLANPNSVVSIYTTDGILLKKEVYIEEIKTLSKGFYILKSGNRSYKIAI